MTFEKNQLQPWVRGRPTQDLEGQAEDDQGKLLLDQGQESPAEGHHFDQEEGRFPTELVREHRDEEDEEGGHRQDREEGVVALDRVVARQVEEVVHAPDFF